MSTIIDIQPPHRKTKNKTTVIKKEEKLKPNKTTGLYIVIILGLFSILAFNFLSDSQVQSDELIKSQNKNSEKEIDNLATMHTKSSTDKLAKISETTKSSTPHTQNQITTLNDSTSNTKQDIDIIVLNGTQKSGVANLAKQILGQNEINVASTGNTQNPYSQTTIYYTSKNKTFAEKIQEILKDYNPKIEENTTLINDKKIIVVIGKNQ